MSGRFNHRQSIFLVLLALVSIAIISVGAVGAGTPFTEEATGVTIGPLTDNPEFDETEEFEDLIESAGLSVPNEVTYLVTSSDEAYVVFSDDPIPAGEATVEGETIPHPDPELDILIADDFDVGTSGQSVTLEELEDDPESYGYDILEIDATTTIGSFANKPVSGVSSKFGLFVFDEPGTFDDDPFDLPPGSQGRWAAINVSPNEIGDHNEEDELFPDVGYTGLSVDREFWGHGDGTLTVVALPTHIGIDGETDFAGLEFWLVDKEYESEHVDDISEIEARGSELEGETVTVETDLVGTATSSQEFLTSVVSCGDQTVWIPTTPVCVPVVADTVVHSGVMVDGSGSTVVPYSGFSNTIQNTVAEPEEGTYTVTGEVVSANELEFDVPGQYGLLVYDMEREGSLSIGGEALGEAESVSEDIQDEIESQLNQSTEGEASAVDGEGDDSVTVSEPPGDADGNTGDGDESSDDDEPSSEDSTPDEPYINETSMEETEVEAGETFEVVADVWNPDDEAGEKELTVYADGEAIADKDADIPIVRAPQTVEASIDEPGVYQIDINDESVGHLEVTEAEDDDSVGQDGSGGQQASEAEPDSVASFVSSMRGNTGGILFVLGIILWVSAIILEGMRAHKQYLSDDEPSLTALPAAILFVVSLASLFTGGVLADIIPFEMVIVAGITGLLIIGIYAFLRIFKEIYKAI